MYIDTHAHINMPDYDSDRNEVIERAFNSGIEAIIDVAYDINSAQKSISLFKNVKNIFSTIGIHPHDAGKLKAETSKIRDIVKNYQIVAIGEIGLDYHYMHSSKEDQKEVFINQLDMAIDLKLPVIIHIREAFEDAKEIMDKYQSSNLKAVFHCFSGDQNFLKYVVNAGWLVSFAGPITFHKAQATRELLKKVPLDKVMIETDCPYLTPVPKRGQRNEPSYIQSIAEKMAEVLSLSRQQLAEQTTQNAKIFFNI